MNAKLFLIKGKRLFIIKWCGAWQLRYETRMYRTRHDRMHTTLLYKNEDLNKVETYCKKWFADYKTPVRYNEFGSPIID